MIMPITDVNVATAMVLRMSVSSAGPPIALAAIAATVGCPLISFTGAAVRNTRFKSRYSTVTIKVPSPELAE